METKDKAGAAGATVEKKRTVGPPTGMVVAPTSIGTTAATPPATQVPATAKPQPLTPQPQSESAGGAKKSKMATKPDRPAARRGSWLLFMLQAMRQLAVLGLVLFVLLALMDDRFDWSGRQRNREGDLASRIREMHDKLQPLDKVPAEIAAQMTQVRSERDERELEDVELRGEMKLLQEKIEGLQTRLNDIKTPPANVVAQPPAPSPKPENVKDRAPDASPSPPFQPRNTLVLILDSPASPAQELRTALAMFHKRRLPLSDAGLGLVVVTTGKPKWVVEFGKPAKSEAFDFPKPPDGASEASQELGPQLLSWFPKDSRGEPHCVLVASGTGAPPRNATWPDVRTDAILVHPRTPLNEKTISEWQTLCTSRRGSVVIVPKATDGADGDRFNATMQFHLHRLTHPLYQLVEVKP